ncbi:Glycosyltransferase involved in cell wall bisynthesis [Quadrisphaera granulorum]|uniref:Glycosyltransferase involved in cell wall biosynthesis n=1 Tax=Quadrisphaera granulorum TaxID=317664 RepID=A0A316AEJ4_9ACTN|nr:glycosyltransferase family 4 protein [Quadrisphaera granulorum]PWJ56041.1 glycosyltransferase involved in cell wall biosynthesis [Quadrisphaera granulorum]SZE94675.1 Glycosyltransferase involved in cell wall bisynthesis [Quadrisphaera granulorum]
MAALPHLGASDVATSRRVLVTHPGAELYGSDRMVLESVQGLLEDGWTVTVALPGEGPLTALLAAAGADCRTVPTPVLRKSAATPRGLISLAASVLRTAPAAWRLLRAERPAAVYVSTLTTPLWLLLAKTARVPVICHVHEAEGNARPLVRLVLTAPLLLADRILVNSRYALDVLLSSVPSLRTRSSVVLNGVRGPEASPVPRPRRSEESLQLVYVGRLSERKGVFVALDAFERLVLSGQDVELTLVGDVFGEHVEVAEQLEQRLAAPAIAGRVHRSGFSIGIWDHLAAADVVLVPSVLPEPFGNTAVEGVLAGRPVVASALGGLPEAVAGVASAQLVEPGSASALADAVLAVSSDLDRFSQCAIRDAQDAVFRFSPQRYRRDIAGSVSDLTGIFHTDTADHVSGAFGTASVADLAEGRP